VHASILQVILVECALSKFKVEIESGLIKGSCLIIMREEASRLLFCLRVGSFKEIVGVHDY
jgi:hypothetical protein